MQFQGGDLILKRSLPKRSNLLLPLGVATLSGITSAGKSSHKRKVP
jgi:hypothetical protein